MSQFLEMNYRAIIGQALALRRTAQSVRPDDSVVTQGKHRIVLFGCGDSYGVAELGRWTFLSMGLNAVTLSPGETKYVQLTDQDLVIAVTASGRSIELIEALKMTKRNGVSTVVLTDNGEGMASDYADWLWLTKSGAESYNISPSATTTSAMAYLLLVASQIDGTHQQLKTDLDRLLDKADDALQWAEAEGSRLAELVVPQSALYMISEGPNLVAAQIGMMKYNEFGVAKGIAAIREEFKHHYVLSTGGTDSAVLILDTPSPRDQDYMNSLRKVLDARVYGLSASAALGLHSSLVQVIPNTMAMQMAAYHTVKRHSPSMMWFRQPNAQAFKIY
ncbi:MAG: SIS domain-containing protein [Candidatus Thorarchaeota archaeon]|nr:SIS domain-containing protein [Candidatus Thorarchaeota archaeon]